jgi:hypothetical protein
MRKSLTRRVIWSVAVLLSGLAFIGSTGCDKTTMTTIQDGVISASSSLLGAVMQSAMNLALEQSTSG